MDFINTSGVSKTMIGILHVLPEEVIYSKGCDMTLTLTVPALNRKLRIL